MDHVPGTAPVLKWTMMLAKIIFLSIQSLLFNLLCINFHFE